MSGTARDVTASKALEQVRLEEQRQDLLLEQVQQRTAAIENERANFRNLFKQTPEMACILKGPDHVFEFVNEAHIKVLGFDATGLAVREAQPESVEVHGILDDVYRTGITAQLHEIPVTVTDRLRYFNLTYAARRDEEGNINGVMILGIEVSDQVRSREELKQSEKKLRDAVRARDEFLSIASHELKTPITSLQLQIQATRRNLKPSEGKMPTPEKLARSLDVQTRQVSRLSRLIEELLDVSRIDAGKLSFTPETLDLSALVRDVVERFTDQLQSVGCPVTVTIETPALLQADRYRLEQVFINLLTNAMKYGAGQPVEIRVAQDRQSTRLVVADHGMGIAKEKQSLIFDRFERAITHENISGLGLGLYIAREIITAHQGTIEVESDLGRGSTFTVTLPAVNEGVSAAHG